MTSTHPASRLIQTVLLLSVLLSTGCGGGGGGGSSSGNGNNAGNGTTGGWIPGAFENANRFAARCVAPRNGIDPTTGRDYPDVAGTATDENNWLRSWSNELYLWYDEIDDVDPARHDTLDYFDLLKTFATTPSGNPKDRFHFWYPTDDWVALSQSGVTAGYGAEWIVVEAYPPRQVLVAYTEPNSPARKSPAVLGRGAEVLSVDGVDLVYGGSQADVDTLNFGLWPAQTGETHTFTVRDPDGTERSVTMRSANVTSTPVQVVRTIADPFGLIGYMLFNDHIATAEQGLIDAVEQLRDAGVTDLVLDLRYNGGGYLDIASELAYMIAGPGLTDGRTFEQVVFNGKHPVTNPVTGEPLEPIPFHKEAQGFSAPFGQRLPTLNLSRVFVLTGPDTCSASESVMNSLQGVDVEVIQIGSTTCGKPYGFYPADNCGTTYFSIQFQGVNAKGFGEYTDGFTPGCFVSDDFTHSLGDPDEARFSTALAWRSGAGCTTRNAQALSVGGRMSRLAAVDGRLNKSPWLENRTLRR